MSRPTSLVESIAQIIPRIPLTYDPSNQVHLQEVECANDLSSNILSKARWIKPAYRRHPKQNYSYATFALTSATEANRLIRDEMYICSARMFPKRLKYKPRQGMKCRKWGHYVAKCQASINTCGTCGGEHTNRECNEQDKRYCVSCWSEGHASWDRMCPKFQRKSTHFDKLHLENILTYFPTEEIWTLNARPERIPPNSSFPAKYSIGLPPIKLKNKSKPNNAYVHKQRGRVVNKEAKTQGTLDKYIEHRAAAEEQPCNASTVRDKGNQSNEEEEQEASSLIQALLPNE